MYSIKYVSLWEVMAYLDMYQCSENMMLQTAGSSEILVLYKYMSTRIHSLMSQEPLSQS
jgi:hypothetical protein